MVVWYLQYITALKCQIPNHDLFSNDIVIINLVSGLTISHHQSPPYFNFALEQFRVVVPTDCDTH